MEIINLSNSERCRVAEEILAATEFKNNGIRRIILLPVPSFRDGEHVSGTGIGIGEACDMLTPGDLLVGYGVPRLICDRASEVGASTLDLLQDGKFIFKNNELTAHATLGYILSALGADVSDLKIGIIGYGSLGTALTRLLLFLGAELTVFSGSEEKRISLLSAGVSALDYGELVNVECDVLINTAPACYLDGKMPRLPLLLDLASGNHYADYGATSLPSLPEKRYPMSAGKAYAKAVIDYHNLH